MCVWLWLGSIMCPWSKICHHIKDGYKSASPGHRTSPNRDSNKLVQFVNSEPGSKAPLSEAISQILCNKKGMSFICRNLSACTWTRNTCCICLACPLNAHPKKKLVLEAVTQFYKELPRESPTGWSVDPTLLEVLLYNRWTPQSPNGHFHINPQTGRILASHKGLGPGHFTFVYL